jgi:hypothetical protein
MPDLNIGYLPQEPQLDPTKPFAVVEEAVSGVIKDAQARLDQVYARYAERMPTSTNWRPNRPSSKPSCKRATATTLSASFEIAADALRHRPGIAKSNTCRVVKSAVWPVPPAALSPGHAAARQTYNHLDADSVAETRHFLHDFRVPWCDYASWTAAGWILELDRSAGITHEATSRVG